MIVDHLRQRLNAARAENRPERVRVLHVGLLACAKRGTLLAHNRPGDHDGGGGGTEKVTNAASARKLAETRLAGIEQTDEAFRDAAADIAMQLIPELEGTGSYDDIKETVERKNKGKTTGPTGSTFVDILDVINNEGGQHTIEGIKDYQKVVSERVSAVEDAMFSARAD